MRFSQRQGYTTARSALQIDDIDSPLRNSLWNAVQAAVWDSHRRSDTHNLTSNSNLSRLIKGYWQDFFKSPTDQIPIFFNDALKKIRDFYFSCEWFEVYDFIEFTIESLGQSRGKFVELCNKALEKEMSGFRIVNDSIVPITDQSELSSIDESIAAAKGEHSGVSTHLKRALELLSDRKSPDYRNSIKESISAVESVVQSITKDPSASLGGALRHISRTAPMHPALHKSLTSLYGYTSDSQGIRHALLEEPNLDFNDAKFMLVACAAFVNLLIGKSSEDSSSS